MLVDNDWGVVVVEVDVVDVVVEVARTEVAGAGVVTEVAAGWAGAGEDEHALSWRAAAKPARTRRVGFTT